MIDGALLGLLTATISTASIHTITGPDHYLPFIAIAKSKNYSIKKTLIWTFVCGIGHICSALLLAIGFIYFSNLLSRTKFEWLENNRSVLASYLLFGLGVVYMIWALIHNYLHKKGIEHKHHHILPQDEENKNIFIWIMFIIFVLGPCEALLPILTAASVMGPSVIFITTITFSIVTIVSMLLMVFIGLKSIDGLKMKFFEKYSHEIAAGTIMVCGLAIMFGL
ncbi:MAG: hypothetical protein IJ853_01045 [Rickettsiales bacterium]|nr:hypothetical protein [Rickettsiales bacterium]